MIFDDPSLNTALQSTAPGLAGIMFFISFVAGPTFLMFIIPVILWCIDSRLGIRLMALYSISFGINSVIELFFHAPRPYWVSRDVTAFTSETSFSLPSCHAQVSATVFGYIAVWVKTRAAWIACIAVILLVGISRMYLGVHFLRDILGGWIVALVIILVALRYGDAAAAWFYRQGVPARVLAALVLSGAVVVASQLVILSFGAWQVPAAWSGLALAQTGVAIDPISMGDALLAAGILFGALAGAGICADHLRYNAGGSRKHRAARAVLGLIVIFLILAILDGATKMPGLAGSGMTYVRFTLIGLWITLGAPYLFCRLGLMSRE
ncbi:MAG: phosphatase PAP2 family protein [Methanomicrobiales archaeon]|nr:phosphatase PAP2 family protein [Methanomicrobiales archaeon]